MKKSIEKTAEIVETSVEKKPLANINGNYIYPETAITWNIANNPKRPSGKAHARFAEYMSKETVQEYLDAGGTLADLKHDNGKGYLDFSKAE